MAEETELSTNVEVGIGLPSDVLVTLVVEQYGNLTVVVLYGVGVGVEVATNTVVTL